MNIQERISALSALGKILNNAEEGTASVAWKAANENPWFEPVFVQNATDKIVTAFLQENELTAFAEHYQVGTPRQPKSVGIVFAGNIPMVGFHDLLMVLLSGNKAVIKYSSKDRVLMEFAVQKLIAINPAFEQFIVAQEQLKGCDAYIATGSNNSGRYFEYYFAKYPHIIRRNRTSVAILNGKESKLQLERLATDILEYFGLGCRNVTALRVPYNYDWQPLLGSLGKYAWMKDHHKFRNNYDYQLSLHLLNNKFYMTDGNLLLVENESLFSPIASLHYQYTDDYFDETEFATDHSQDLQCLVGGKNGIHFGQAQTPALDQFADGVDTMTFLQSLDR